MKKLSERSALAKKQGEDKKKQYDAKILEAMQELTLTDSGIIVLTHLKNICGFGDTNVVCDPQTGKVLSDNVIYNNAQENVYKGLRKYLSKKAKIKIEINN